MAPSADVLRLDLDEPSLLGSAAARPSYKPAPQLPTRSPMMRSSSLPVTNRAAAAAPVTRTAAKEDPGLLSFDEEQLDRLML